MSDSRARYVIVGAGGFGREVHQWLNDYLRAQSLIEHGDKDFEIVVVDNSPEDILCSTVRNLWKSNLEAFEFDDEDRVLVAIGSPSVRMKVVGEIEQKAGTNKIFYNLIHPTALIADTSKIGVGLIACPHSVVCANAILGNHIHINLGSLIGHDAVISDFVTMSSQCDVTGAAKLGTGVFMGSGSRILPKVSVADWSRLGAGVVVSKSTDTKLTFFHSGTKRVKL